MRYIALVVLLIAIAGCTNNAMLPTLNSMPTQANSPLVPTHVVQATYMPFPTYTPYPTSTPAPAVTPSLGMIYLWPQNLPQGFSIERQSAEADETSFKMFILVPSPNRAVANELYLTGGLCTEGGKGCSFEEMETESVEIHGNPGLIGHLIRNDGWFLLWHENGNTLSLGGWGVDKETVVSIAENALRLNLSQWIKQLAQQP
jgi:hypothetical protein